MHLITSAESIRDLHKLMLRADAANLLNLRHLDALLDRLARLSTACTNEPQRRSRSASANLSPGSPTAAATANTTTRLHQHPKHEQYRQQQLPRQRRSDSDAAREARELSLAKAAASRLLTKLLLPPPDIPFPFASPSDSDLTLRYNNNNTTNPPASTTVNTAAAAVTAATAVTLTPRDCASLLSALSRLDLVPERPLAEALQGALLGRLYESSVRDRVQLLHASAKLGLGLPLGAVSELLRSLDGGVLAATGKPQDVSMVLWSLATMRLPPSPDWLRRLLASLPPRRLAAFQPQALANSTWALACLGFRPEAEWLGAMVDAARPQLKAFRTQELCNLLWALAVLRHRPPAGWLVDAAERLGELAADMGPQDLAQVCWALSRLAVRPGLPLLHRLVARALAVRREMDAQALIATLWGLSGLRVQLPERAVALLLQGSMGATVLAAAAAGDLDTVLSDPAGSDSTSGAGSMAELMAGSTAGSTMTGMASSMEGSKAASTTRSTIRPGVVLMSERDAMSGADAAAHPTQRQQGSAAHWKEQDEEEEEENGDSPAGGSGRGVVGRAATSAAGNILGHGAGGPSSGPRSRGTIGGHDGGVAGNLRGGKRAHHPREQLVSRRHSAGSRAATAAAAAAGGGGGGGGGPPRFRPMGPGDLAGAVLVLARCHHVPHRRWLSRFCAAVDRQLGRFGPKDISTLLYGLAGLGAIGVRPDPRWVDRLLAAAERMAAAEPPAPPPQPQPLAVSPPQPDTRPCLYPIAGPSAPPQAAGASGPADLEAGADVAGTGAPAQIDPWAVCDERAKECVRLDAAQLAIVLWAVARLRHVPAQSWVAAMARAVSARVEEFGPQEAAACIRALQHLAAAPSPPAQHPAQRPAQPQAKNPLSIPKKSRGRKLLTSVLQRYYPQNSTARTASRGATETTPVARSSGGSAAAAGGAAGRPASAAAAAAAAAVPESLTGLVSRLAGRLPGHSLYRTMHTVSLTRRGMSYATLADQLLEEVYGVKSLGLLRAMEWGGTRGGCL